jgi:hypothetical protein
MCDGMRLDRRLIILGTIIVVLSMSMATQYATTRATYSFAIVHPSESDIRYIASDNSSDDGKRVYRVTNNASGTMFATIELGNWMPNSRKNYTAAFGIVNEEQFTVNITHINISGTNASFMSIWLHGDRDADYTSDGASSVMVVRDGDALYSASDVVWTLGAGDNDVESMNGGALATPWDDTAGVRYSIDDTTNAVNETSDFVWVGISIELDQYAATQSATGTIYIYFKSTTLE